MGIGWPGCYDRFLKFLTMEDPESALRRRPGVVHDVEPTDRSYVYQPEGRDRARLPPLAPCSRGRGKFTAICYI